jgi:hypothetical protein
MEKIKSWFFLRIDHVKPQLPWGATRYEKGFLGVQGPRVQVKGKEVKTLELYFRIK